jgi:putative sigma-54 modulation protein
MRLELTGRHVVFTPANRELVQRRLEPIARMLNDNLMSMQVVVMKEKFRHHVDIRAHARGDHFFHGDGIGRNIGAALGEAVEKIEHQARRLKTQWSQRRRRGRLAAKPNAPPPPEPAVTSKEPELPVPTSRVIRARRYIVAPMTVKEAARRVDQTHHPFIVFRDRATGSVSVMFRRPDGHLGLIEPEP